MRDLPPGRAALAAASRYVQLHASWAPLQAVIAWGLFTLHTFSPRSSGP